LGGRSRAPKKTSVPEEIEFRTKPQIALSQIVRALANGIRVSAWTFDEFYGRDRAFLDGIEAHRQLFVGEIPCNFHGWLQQPTVLRTGPKTTGKCGRQKHYPRVARRRPSCEARNLLKHSPVFREQSWQRYRIKDTDHGPEVWEVKWTVFWRKDAAGLPTRRHCLIVAHNVLTGEVKYFLANRVPGERHPVTGQYVTLRGLLRVAFGRWSIESCFREGKEELGLDHYEVRGWRCVHRHFFVTQLSHLFCARVRQEYDNAPGDRVDRITVEQVRSAMDVWLDSADLPPRCQRQRFEKQRRKQQYYERRNKQARISHTKTRRRRLNELGIDADRIKSCLPRKDSP
jgi:SRSO17 transposase